MIMFIYIYRQHAHKSANFITSPVFPLLLPTLCRIQLSTMYRAYKMRQLHLTQFFKRLYMYIYTEQ